MSVFQQLNTLSIDKARLKRVRVLFPLHREGLTSYFSPILGQYAIKNTEFLATFVKQFHLVTHDIFKATFNEDAVEERGLCSDELIVPIIVDVFKAGKFSLTILTPSVGFLFSLCFKKRRRIYRHLNKKLKALRNYKKVFQLAMFKRYTNVFVTSKTLFASNATLFSINASTYNEVRNSIHQRK
jgi:hypothetical protein